ncbi:MAG: DUF927 domain-containing protein, partial [Ferrovibrio sp.]
MEVEWTIGYLGDGPDSNGNQHAALRITRPGVGFRNVAIPFTPTNGLDPVKAISSAVGLIKLPMITPGTKSAVLKKFEEVMALGSASGKIAVIADEPGWLPNGQFMSPSGELFGEGNEAVAITLSGISRPHRWTKLGSLRTWKKTAKRLGRKNSSIIFACTSALAGPLLKRQGLEGVIFCYKGRGSVGKTTTLD